MAVFDFTRLRLALGCFFATLPPPSPASALLTPCFPHHTFSRTFGLVHPFHVVHTFLMYPLPSRHLHMLIITQQMFKISLFQGLTFINHYGIVDGSRFPHASLVRSLCEAVGASSPQRLYHYLGYCSGGGQGET